MTGRVTTNYTMVKRSHLASILIAALICATARADGFHSKSLSAVSKAATQGDADAQLEFALRWDYGIGVRRSERQAEKWYRAAAEQGNAQAQNSVGSLLQARGRYDDARAWFERAAAQGLPQGVNNLAYLYDLGLGVPQDREKALHLYEKAADGGWAESMWNLATMHALGQFVPVSNSEACVWTYRARKFAQPYQRELLQHVDAGIAQQQHTLSADELRSCQDKAAEWTHASAPTTK